MYLHTGRGQHLQHPSAGARAQRRRATVIATLAASGTLLLASCGSDSSAATVPSAEVTTAETDAVADSTPATDPPTTISATTVAPTTMAPTTSAATNELTLEEASGMAEVIINSWNTDNVQPIEDLLGPTGVWIAITGDEFDATTIAGWLDPIGAVIGDTEHNGDPVAVTDGFSFPLVDVDSGGPFFLVIARGADDVLRIEESPTEPAPAGAIVVEGTTTEPEDQVVEGAAGPDGSVPYSNLKVFDGGLVGEGNAVGSYVIGDESINGSEMVDFTGELVGVGTGTFTYTDTFTVLFDGTFNATAQIVGTGGDFENLVGTIDYTSTDYGSNRTFTATFTPAP